MSSQLFHIELMFAGVNMFLARLRLILAEPQARALMSSEKGSKHTAKK